MMLAAGQPAVSVAALSVLLAGEREEDFFLIRDILSRNTTTVPTELDHATSMEEAKTMLQQKVYGWFYLSMRLEILRRFMPSRGFCMREFRCRLSC